MSYESPVKLYDFVHEISEKFTEERDKYIYQRIRTYVDVDKEELIKALQYDRDQYKKGYEDGMKDTKKRCKALELLLEWAVECDFGFDNLQDIYDKYADKLDKSKSYREKMIQLAEIYLEDGEQDDSFKR